MDHHRFPRESQCGANTPFSDSPICCSKMFKVLMTVRWQNIWPSRALNEKISPLIPLLLQSGLTEVPFGSISWIVSIPKQICGWTVSLFSISMSNHYQISIYLSIYLSVCLSIYLPTYLPTYLSIYLSTSFYLHSIQVYIPHDKHIFFVAIFSIVIPWDSSVTCSSSATLGASDGWGSIHVIHLDEGVVHLPGGDEDLDEGG